MSNPENIFQLGPNAYGKPATALNILRETVMGHDLFDHAFKTYSNRWKFNTLRLHIFLDPWRMHQLLI